MKNRQARYQVGDIIGNALSQYRVYQVHMGGMGEVYLCLDKDRIPFALKTFQGTSPNLRDLFEKEVKTWVDLGKHPNIVQCYWMDVFNNTPFMGLEWIAGDEFRGADLRGWLRYGALDLKQALKFAIDIVRGLVYAGEKSDKPIVHRDLKPDNVLVAQGGLAKITDFGLATIINQAGLSDNTDENDEFDAGKSRYVGNIVGTPAYMPPEQWRGDADIDPRADIYAVGCILYEMLTGKMVYTASTISQSRLQHLEAPIPTVLNVPAEVNSIIGKCLAKNRADRYSTVTALLEALTHFYEMHIGETLPPVQVQEMTAVDYSNRGVTYANLKLYDLALADYDEAIFLDPNYATAYNNRGTCYTNLGQYERAIADFDEAIFLDPKLATAHYNRGISYGELGQHDRAIVDFDTTIRFNSNLALANNNLGAIYEKKGMIDEAIVNYTEAIRLNPNLALAYYNLGAIYEKKGMIDEAIVNYTEAIRLNPNYVKAYINRGNSYDNKGMDDLAIADYNEAIRLDSNSDIVYYNRGISYKNKGMDDLAIADFSSAIRLNPNYVKAYYNRGISYKNKGMDDLAIADFSSAIRLNPEYSSAYINRGVSYEKKGMYDEAIADHTEAIRLNPDNADAYYNRGVGYYKKGMYDKAIIDHTKTVFLNPEDRDAWFNNGAAYQNIGRLEEALACFEKARQLGQPRALGAIHQIKKMMGETPEYDEQTTFEAFQLVTSLDEMRHIVAQYPMLTEMIQTIQQTIQMRVPQNLKSYYQTRLAWLIQIAKGG